VVEDASVLLEGQSVDDSLIEQVAEQAMRVSHPLDNADMDYWYRKQMTRVYVKRALRQLCTMGANANDA
jgi:CO/xanthine dehydrogenase FAD-binding subunit